MKDKDGKFVSNRMQWSEWETFLSKQGVRRITAHHAEQAAGIIGDSQAIRVIRKMEKEKKP